MAELDTRKQAPATSTTERAAPRQNVSLVNGVEIAWVEWGERGDPLVLLSHATGLHARCWDGVVAHLDGFHVIATDHRGHGRSSTTPPYGWDQFGADLTELIVLLELADIVAVGHSMGGHSLVQAAAREPARFRQLVLFDPVIFDPSIYEAHPAAAEMAHPVAKRRNAWESPQQMIASFRDRKPFDRWHPDVLRDYCQHGLVREGDVYRLACPPEVEAGIYVSSMAANIYDRIELIEIPVAVVRAEYRGFERGLQDFSVSPTWPDLAGRFRNGRDVYIPEWSHFLPQENPALAASIIKDCLWKEGS